MGKAAKEHRKKVQARNARLEQEKRKRDKFQREFIMNLIKQEQEKGMYENNQAVEGPTIDGPILDGPIFDGPSLQIDGPTLDLPVSDGPTIGDVNIESPVTESEIVIDSPVQENSEESEK